MRSGQQHYFEPQGPEVCTSIYVLWMNLCTLLVSICVCVIHWRLSGLNLNAYLHSNVSRLSLKVNGEVKIFLTPPCIAVAFSSAIHISILLHAPSQLLYLKRNSARKFCLIHLGTCQLPFGNDLHFPIGFALSPFCTCLQTSRPPSACSVQALNSCSLF